MQFSTRVILTFVCVIAVALSILSSWIKIYQMRKEISTLQVALNWAESHKRSFHNEYEIYSERLLTSGEFFVFAIIVKSYAPTEVSVELNSVSKRLSAYDFFPDNGLFCTKLYLVGQLLENGNTRVALFTRDAANPIVDEEFSDIGSFDEFCREKATSGAFIDSIGVKTLFEWHKTNYLKIDVSLKENDGNVVHGTLEPPAEKTSGQSDAP